MNGDDEDAASPERGGATQTPIAAQARRVFVASKMTVIDAGAPALCSLNYVEYLEALARVAHADVCQGKALQLRTDGRVLAPSMRDSEVGNLSQ